MILTEAAPYRFAPAAGGTVFFGGFAERRRMVVRYVCQACYAASARVRRDSGESWRGLDVIVEVESNVRDAVGGGLDHTCFFASQVVVGAAQRGTTNDSQSLSGT